jgi:hypothetical protein
MNLASNPMVLFYIAVIRYAVSIYRVLVCYGTHYRYRIELAMDVQA